MTHLKLRAFGGLLILLIVMAALLFISAETLDYWQGWTFLAIFFIPSFAITLYLMKSDPKLLERRLSAGPTAEKGINQRIIMTITSIGFIALLFVPALDYRYTWSKMPFYIVIAGDILIVIGLLIIFFVYKENTFASAIIQVVPEQKVITTGLYSLVRHPMYMGGFFYLSGIPLSLGSWWGLLVMVLMMPALLWRILDEEKFLAKNLQGYAEYQQKVKYRLIPYIW